jgi:hypothetical protein
VYLYYVLDLWLARVVTSRLREKACLARYIDDFVGPSRRGTLLAQDAEQPELDLARADLVEAIPADHGAVSVDAT